MLRKRTGGSFLWSWNRREAFSGNIPVHDVAFLWSVGPIMVVLFCTKIPLTNVVMRAGSITLPSFSFGAVKTHTK